MKHILTSALLLVGISAFAQTTTITTNAPAATQTVTLTPKAKAICKTWSFTQSEVFSDVHQPSDKQKGDQVIFMENGRYRWIYDGVGEGGTWTMDKAGVWITMTNDAGAIKKFKVLEATEKSLKVDYQDLDLVHNVLYFAPTATVNSK